MVLEQFSNVFAAITAFVILDTLPSHIIVKPGPVVSRDVCLFNLGLRPLPVMRCYFWSRCGFIVLPFRYVQNGGNT